MRSHGRLQPRIGVLLLDEKGSPKVPTGDDHVFQQGEDHADLS